jgi:hypothetical protein
MRAKAIFIALLVAVASLVAGCGSSGSASSSGGEGTATSAQSGEETAGAKEEGSVAGNKGSGGSDNGSAGGNEGSAGGGAEAGGPKPKTKSGPPDRNEFILEGDGICANIPNEYGAKLGELEKEEKDKQRPKMSTAEKNLKAAVPPVYVAVEEFEALTPPKGSGREVETIIAALEEAAKVLEREPESELTGPKSPFVEFQSLAKKFGFKYCSEL